MLTLVTFATILLELCSSSPVYNMQPAFITANIGATTGRNIRNLPCISRKNNQSGVCMFAIDCLKANGTHLGTCIDRFYFGSCCHIEPVHDFHENTIDTDIIPARVPPNRLSTTSTTISSFVNTIKPTSTDIVNLINKLGSNITTTEASSTQSITTTNKVVNKTITSTTPTTTTTSTKTKPTIIKQKLTTTEKASLTTTVSPVTQINEKLQTFQSVNGNSVETTTKIITSVPTTFKPVTKAPINTTSEKITLKPVTRKPVNTTKPFSKPTVKPKPSRPVTTTPKPVKATKPTVSKTTRKPTKATAKPVKIPTNATTTKKPITQKPTTVTKKPISTTKPTTKKPLVVTKPTRRVTTKAPAITTKITTTASTTTLTTTPPPKIVTTTTTTTTKPKPQRTTTQTTLLATQTTPIVHPTTKEPLRPPTTESNELPLTKLNISSILETVNGNPATNEIEAAKPVIVPATTEKSTTKPSLVTWTVADDRKNVTAAVDSSSVVNVTTEPEDWVPVTTPDGWVLLPSVSPITNSPIVIETSTSTPPFITTTLKTPTESSTSSPTSTLDGSTMTSSPKPSITYIPLQQSTTDSTVTISTFFTTPSPTVTSPSDKTTPTEKLSDISSTTASSFTANLPGTTFSPDMKPVNMSDFTDVCGRRMFPEARIVGGEKSSFGKWPWQISLRQWRTSTYLHKCGAALLNENWAITAAHCVDNVPPSDLLLRLGEHDLSTESEPYLHQERRVQIVASHPQFDPRTFEYDLALLRFYEPVTFQPNILPVCVPQTDENFVGRTAYVTGWGRLYEDGPLPSILQEVSVPVINNSVCESMYRSAGYIEHIPHIFICAGWRRGGFDSCEGDSGGPMVIQREDKRFLLAGVISWGIGCAEPNQPGVYTRISEFRDWINQILQF